MDYRENYIWNWIYTWCKSSKYHTQGFGTWVEHVLLYLLDIRYLWSKKFHEIVIRYEATIMAQFYGHTHNDETTIFFDNSVDPPRPANTLNIGVSTTAYTHLNPGFKVYFADGERQDATWEMMDHETYVYDLSAANAGQNGQPSWYKLYNMKEAFGLDSLRPADLYDMVVKMVTDDALFQKYYMFHHKNSSFAEPCITARCRLDFLCDVVKADSGDFSHCVRLFDLIEDPEDPDPEDPTTVEGDTETSTKESEGGDNGFATSLKSMTNFYVITIGILAYFNF